MRRANPAGVVKLPAIADHRVTLHLSERTVTRCRDSARLFLRERGHIDLTPAQSVGGFDSDAQSASLEVRIPCGFIQDVADTLPVRAAQSGLEQRHMIQDERLTHLLLAMDAEQRTGALGGHLYMDSLGVALAVQLLTHHAAPTPPPRAGLSPIQIQRVMDFVETHLDSSLPLRELANIAGVSSSHLQRGFRSSRGISVHQYVIRRRVEKARILLTARSLPASEVALLAGFAHQSHMTRWMRRLLGVTPRELLPR
jgi:AraC family transcriptional regulator